MGMKEALAKAMSLLPGVETPEKNKLRQAVYFEKDIFLRTWKIENLREICKEKGISTIQEDIVTNMSGTDITKQELDFYALIRIIVEKISSMELITYAKAHKISYQNFETKVNELNNFYNKKK